MSRIKYSHLVEYDEAANRIVITRLFETGKPSLYALLAIDDLPPSERTFEVVSRKLGESLILDMRKLCDEVLP